MTRLQKPALPQVPSGAARREGNAAADNSNTPSALALIAQAQQAFRTDLTGLLLKCPGHWVAYHGEKRIGIGQDERLLYEKCFRRGLSREQFIVRQITAESPIPNVTPLHDV
jgi:hypothetical protein